MKIYRFFKHPFVKKNISRIIMEFIVTRALRLLALAAGGHFMSAGGALWAPGVTWMDCRGDNTSKYVCPTVIIDITRKITKFVNF